MTARRIVLWAIPGILVVVLVLSLLPRGGAPVRPGSGQVPRPPAAGTPADTATAKAGEGAGPGAETPQAPAAETAPPVQAPYGEIRGGELVGTDESGRRRWRITADEVTLAKGKDVVLLRGVRGTFYALDGTTLSVSGDLGRYDTGTREVDLEGDVHGVNGTGRELFADRLHYSPAANEITGSGHVRLIEERVIMHADRMVSNTTLGETRFFGHINITSR